MLNHVDTQPQSSIVKLIKLISQFHLSLSLSLSPLSSFILSLPFYFIPANTYTFTNTPTQSKFHHFTDMRRRRRKKIIHFLLHSISVISHQLDEQTPPFSRYFFMRRIFKWNFVQILTLFVFFPLKKKFYFQVFS